MHYIKTIWNVISMDELNSSLFWLGATIPIVIISFLIGSYIIGTIGLIILGLNIKRIYNNCN